MVAIIAGRTSFAGFKNDVKISFSESPIYYAAQNNCLGAIFGKSHPTCDSKVFRISRYFSQLKIKVIPEYGRNFSFIKHFVDFLWGSRDNSSFSKNIISVHKLYFESPLSLLELLFRVKVTSTRTLLGTEHNLKKSTLSLLETILFY